MTFSEPDVTSRLPSGANATAITQVSLRPGRRVVKQHRAVLAAAGEPFAIRREGDRTDPPGRDRNPPQFFPGGAVPEADGAVAIGPGGSQGAAVGRERHRVDEVGVALQAV